MEEKLLWDQGFMNIAGIDEVGRGAFAGPVVVAAVIFSPNYLFRHPLLHEINDSKKLTPRKRKELDSLIKEEALCYTIREGSIESINSLGVGKATQSAFLDATKLLCHIPDFLLIDAFYIESVDKSIQKPIIRGDSLSISIAAASIIAKVYRDELMTSFHVQYPNYDFLENKGYGTARHREKLGLYGLSPLHRTSFNLSNFLTPSVL